MLMKKRQLEKIKAKSVSTLRSEVLKLKKEKQIVSAQIKIGREANLKKAHGLGRDIAQIMTIIHEKERKEK
ncbi:MAG: hypothetical protein UW21_C0001G0026 [Candidatus Woesebacteria bacterium GW2011_GWB1_44_11b]|uniref:Large ribosomal subunit protein uL29 n=1 Tax=Candidatus Woesebacteria bacterium GW2011_GWB1_44_11b TaxID=1618580 RepID=A0A0G1GID2_9BACT|nr:MAG: hypothetical protein UW21_C0001G0026 [Candidatus Woesebacteria bacterium GW2011_GWB1_44_11b]